MQGGVPQWISAQSFIDARNSLEFMCAEAIKKQEPPQPYLSQLVALEVGFIDHCEKWMLFAKDFAEKSLSQYMLNAQPQQLAKDIANDLTSASKYFTHGRTISAQFIKNSPPLDKLNVEVLEKNSVEWKMLFELYLRSELFLDMDNQPQQRKGKLIEAATFSMWNFFPS